MVGKTTAEEKIERVPFSTRINKNIIKNLKRISVEEERDVYVLVEEALEKLIQQKKH